jgi:hypothetical protein
MIIDAEKIISDTINVFQSSEVQKKKFSEITEYVSEDNYKKIHPQALTPLDIKIDCDLFLTEIEKYSNYFVQWGGEHLHLPRYGLALVNQDGILDKPFDPINGSLYEWNNKNPNTPLIESDCRVPTDVMTIESLQPLSVFNKHWCRSNIFKWHDGADFKPHIDAVVPSPWIRLWATTNPESLDVRFYDAETQDMKSFSGIEAGRIYVIDTSLVHDAICYQDNTYQLFLSVLPSAYETILRLLK